MKQAIAAIICAGFILLTASKLTPFLCVDQTSNAGAASIAEWGAAIQEACDIVADRVAAQQLGARATSQALRDAFSQPEVYQQPFDRWGARLNQAYIDTDGKKSWSADKAAEIIRELGDATKEATR